MRTVNTIARRMLKKPSIDQDFIRQLASVLTDSDLSEIEVEQDGLRIRLARSIVASYVAAPMPAPYAAGAPAAAAPASAVETKAADPASHPGAVPSPMVGTVYRSPAPGARPFVEVGDVVSAGQTVVIVEAMKHMNQIAAPRAGKVKEILVEDGQPVEYGEVLLIVE
jgi:acetyl-CoA carboxylase biotin carboxyl carrier protein